MPPRPPKVLRSQFAEVAWKLGCEGGYDAVKIRAIAEQLGVSGALLYTYFEDKAALMDEMRIVGLAELERALDGTLDVERSAALLRLAMQYVGYMRAHAWLYHGDSKQELHGATSAHAETFIARAATLSAPESGDLREGSRALAVHLWLALRGIVTTGGASLPGFDDGFVERHVKLVVRGVSPTARAD